MLEWLIGTKHYHPMVKPQLPSRGKPHSCAQTITQPQATHITASLYWNNTYDVKTQTL